MFCVQYTSEGKVNMLWAVLRKISWGWDYTFIGCSFFQLQKKSSLTKSSGQYHVVFIGDGSP